MSKEYDSFVRESSYVDDDAKYERKLNLALWLY